MSKVEKKRKKLLARLTELQSELSLSLTKKSSATAEIDVAGHQRKIEQVRKQLNELG